MDFVVTNAAIGYPVAQLLWVEESYRLISKLPAIILSAVFHGLAGYSQAKKSALVEKIGR